MKKTLLVYYSRGGNTEKVAQKAAKAFACDADRLVYKGGKKPGFLSAILECMLKKTPDITGDDHNPTQYKTVVFLTPIWAGVSAPPIRSYLKKYGGNITSYAVIATSASSGIEGVVAELEKTLGKAPKKSQLILAKDIAAGNFQIDDVTRGK